MGKVALARTFCLHRARTCVPAARRLHPRREAARYTQAQCAGVRTRSARQARACAYSGSSATASSSLSLSVQSRLFCIASIHSAISSSSAACKMMRFDGVDSVKQKGFV